MEQKLSELVKFGDKVLLISVDGVDCLAGDQAVVLSVSDEDRVIVVSCGRWKEFALRMDFDTIKLPNGQLL